MDDIVKSLRKGVPCIEAAGCEVSGPCKIMNAHSGCACAEAADEIERLRAGNRDLQLWWDNLRPDHARLEAENAKLREAVSWLANLDMDRFTEHDEALLETAIEEARAALGGDT